MIPAFLATIPPPPHSDPVSEYDGRIEIIYLAAMILGALIWAFFYS